MFWALSYLGKPAQQATSASLSKYSSSYVWASYVRVPSAWHTVDVNEYQTAEAQVQRAWDEEEQSWTAQGFRLSLGSNVDKLTGWNCFQNDK